MNTAYVIINGHINNVAKLDKESMIKRTIHEIDGEMYLARMINAISVKEEEELYFKLFTILCKRGIQIE